MSHLNYLASEEQTNNRDQKADLNQGNFRSFRARDQKSRERSPSVMKKTYETMLGEARQELNYHTKHQPRQGSISHSIPTYTGLTARRIIR